MEVSSDELTVTTFLCPACGWSFPCAEPFDGQHPTPEGEPCSERAEPA